MFHLLKKCLSLFSAPAKATCPRLLHSYQPACVLLNDRKILAQTPYGDVPVTLSEDLCLEWQMVAPNTPISSLKLRVGTYGRRNACHLVVQIHTRQAQISLADCADNQYADIRFDPPLHCQPEQVLTLRAHSPDARLAQDVVVALWCSRPLPQFADSPTLTPLYFAATDKQPTFSILLNAKQAPAHLYQSLRSLLESDPHADKELLVYGATPNALPWLSGAVTWLASPADAADQAQGEFLLWLAQPALLRDGSLQALRETLLAHPQTLLVMPKVIDKQGYLCSAGGQAMADASLWTYPSAADATHPEFNQPRTVCCAQPPCVLLRQAALPALLEALSLYQSATYVLLHLSLHTQTVRYCPTACAQVVELEQAPEADRQLCQRIWQVRLDSLPLPLLPWSTPPRLHCPETDKPLISIVIPLFNQVRYSAHCLHTLLHCDAHLSREIILVDNASSDATPQLLAGLTGAFRVLRNLDNRGFVDACNQGAALAQGTYLLLLNNDTQVRPGALENLVNILENQSGVGIVGAKLLYPDGRLQEAGCQLFADGSATNLGRSGDAQAEFACQDRDVDYCSGAALMLRTALWRQLGGFDRRYAPAYYEDTDLCMQARQAGLRVRYCHAAEVIHYEGVTAGVDVNSGYKAYQVRNQQRFYAKWQAVLQEKASA